MAFSSWPGGEEVEDGIGFCSPIILATGIRQRVGEGS